MILHESDYLEHYGVKGMHWGQRRSAVPGVHPRTNRIARKDAKEFARAKMFYGEGAGTRRKLINKSVEAKKARDPAYAKAFEQHVSRQNLDKHATKARRERKTKDTVKTGKGLARDITGHPSSRAAILALGLGGVAYLNSPQGKVKMKQSVNFAKKHAAEIKRKNGARKIKKILDNLQ